MPRYLDLNPWGRGAWTLMPSQIYTTIATDPAGDLKQSPFLVKPSMISLRVTRDKLLHLSSIDR